MTSLLTRDSMSSTTSVLIRPYREEDRNRLRELLQLNTPAYFDPAEETDFEEYLSLHREEYFVLETDGIIVGCGGVNFSEDRSVGKISWDIFHPDCQGQGLGRLLTEYRIQMLREIPGIKTISVRTSQLVYRFYEKMGFKLKETAKDYWAPGLDMYRLEMTA